MSKIGFIDEYGDKSIQYQKSGVSTFFIVSAVVIESDNLGKYNEIINSIRVKHTQSPELKSKKFSDDLKRIELLNDLIQLDFFVYSIIVDKRKVWEDSGLKFRNSFFKYVNRLLDSELYKYYPNLELVADEHGDDKFMTGFIDYVKSNHIQTDLFLKPEFRFAKSNEEPLIQVADIISGSLARIYDPEKKSDNSNLIFEILKPKILQLRIWPELPLELFKHITKEDEQFDQEISEFSMQLINSYLIENEKSNDEIIIQQIITLNYLVFRFKNNPFEYVYTDEIITRIKQRGKSVLSVQLFRNKIIAGLRDANILIVSGQSGYKIPCSKADIFHFFNRYNHIINPMLLRLDKANDMLKIATDNKINAFENTEFSNLEKMIQILKS